MNFLSNVIADSAQQAGGMFGGNSMWVMILIYGAIIAGVYFFLIRPNSKKKKEEAQMRNSLEIGDEITTIGGIMGRVVAIKDDEDAIVIETGSDRVKMKFKKWRLPNPKRRASASSKRRTRTQKRNNIFA